jgi:hypothetical protein
MTNIASIIRLLGPGKVRSDFEETEFTQKIRVHTIPKETLSSSYQVIAKQSRKEIKPDTPVQKGTLLSQLSTALCILETDLLETITQFIENEVKTSYVSIKPFTKTFVKHTASFMNYIMFQERWNGATEFDFAMNVCSTVIRKPIVIFGSVFYKEYGELTTTPVFLKHNVGSVVDAFDGSVMKQDFSRDSLVEWKSEKEIKKLPVAEVRVLAGKLFDHGVILDIVKTISLKKNDLIDVVRDAQSHYVTIHKN